MKRALVLALLIYVPASALGAPGDAVPPDAGRLEREIATAEGELESLASAREATKERLAQRTRALYRLSRRPAVEQGEGLEGVLAHHARVRRLARVVQSDLEALRVQEERRVALARALDEKRASLSEERVRLAAIEARRRQLEDRARIFAGDLPGLGVAPVAPLVAQGGSIFVHGEDESLSLGFASLRGKLGAPVRGTFRVRDAVRDGGPGLELLVGQGTPVHSVADGRVAYSDRDPDHGRLVIVDHGQSYFTVYGGLAAVRASIGAFVAKGEALGTADASGVFFEVRQGARSLDPRHWTGL